MNFAKQLSNMIAKSIQQAYEQTEEVIKKSYKNVDDKLDAIKLFSLNIIREVDKLASQAEKDTLEKIISVEENNKKSDYEELPQYIILKDGTKKDCPIVLESKYVEEVLDFILPLLEKDIDYDPNCSYPPIFKQKEWFEKDLKRSGYFGIDDGFSSQKYILSYRENKDYNDK